MIVYFNNFCLIFNFWYFAPFDPLDHKIILFSVQPLIDFATQPFPRYFYQTIWFHFNVLMKYFQLSIRKTFYRKMINYQLLFGKKNNNWKCLWLIRIRKILLDLLWSIKVIKNVCLICGYKLLSNTLARYWNFTIKPLS